MLYILFIIACGYMLVVASIYALQRHLIYHVDKDIEPPSAYHLEGFSEYFIPTPDHETIQLWYHPAAHGFPTIVYYHGNSYTLGDRAGIYNAIAEKGFGILALSYRGYGKSSGSPTEQGLYIDARTTLEYANKNLAISPSHIILYGESLGTGVATQMATEFPVGGLVLQSPYKSVMERAEEMYDFIPVQYLIKDKYKTIDKIGQVKAPLLIFHGERDKVIPIAHGRAVLAAANDPKEAIFFPDVGHNDFDSKIISEHLLVFAEKYNLISH